MIEPLKEIAEWKKSLVESKHDLRIRERCSRCDLTTLNISQAQEFPSVLYYSGAAGGLLCTFSFVAPELRNSSSLLSSSSNISSSFIPSLTLSLWPMFSLPLSATCSSEDWEGTSGKLESSLPNGDDVECGMSRKTYLY